jgi:hypothetical protein
MVYQNGNFIQGGVMLRYLFMALFVALIGGVAVLAFWQIPAPAKPTEVVIPNDRFKL